ncbi:Perlucin-like protein [Chionoecetes opilio]|uniref:Perlucin-like protein n=1 Tax=Chionoecetes opilio TaxID=41210 RepID=A0A8J4Y112_CHIOP|nr:Perlucin-like protein [Chionoecetes opilio]
MKGIVTLAVAAAVLGLCSAEYPCPDGFVNLGSDPVEPKCLGFGGSSSGTWHSMLSICELLGGSLAKITGDMHNKVYQYILDRPTMMDKCFWIGGNDEHMEAHWVWVSDDTELPLGGPHWDPCDREEPNGGFDENYLAICPDRYYFKDYPGDKLFHAICQVETGAIYK